MNWPIAAAVIAALAVLAVLVYWVRQSAAPVVHSGKQRPFRMEDWPPRTTRPLTQGELRTFIFLRRSLPECLLLPQIALARFLSVTQSRSYNQWFGSVGRRCVDFLVCSEQGDVLGVIQLESRKKTKQNSEGAQRKLKALEMASIPVWQLDMGDLPDAKTLRDLVLPELKAAEEHSKMISMLNQEPSWQPTRVEPRASTAAAPQPVDALEAARWDQAWPSEDARSSDFLDQFGMIEVPPLVIKGSGRSATGFTRG